MFGWRREGKIFLAGHKKQSQVKSCQDNQSKARKNKLGERLSLSGELPQDRARKKGALFIVIMIRIATCSEATRKGMMDESAFIQSGLELVDLNKIQASSEGGKKRRLVTKTVR